jgi:hypothetical protein
MESDAFMFLQVLGFALSSGLTGYKFLNKFKKKNNLFVVLSTRKIGLTTNLKKVKENIEGKVVLIDRDDIIESQNEELKEKLKSLMDERKDAFDLLFYPLVKQYLKDCSRVFKNVPLVLFVNDEHLIKFLKVSNNNVLTLVPTVSMFQKLIDSYKLKEDNKAVNSLIKSREDLIISKYNKVLIKNWNDLEELLVKIINPKS